MGEEPVKAANNAIATNDPLLILAELLDKINRREKLIDIPCEDKEEDSELD